MTAVTTAAFAEDFIDRMYRPITGHLAALIPNYVVREGQIKLTRAIDTTVVEKKILLGEAATGIGKSLAYLIPTIHYSLQENTPVLIVTANKALQEQLIDKDLPLLLKAFEREGKSFTFQLLKGRSNYLCQNELASFDNGIPMPGLSSDEQTQLYAVSAWGRITTTGDQSDAPAGISTRAWNSVTVSGDRCARHACTYKTTCFANKALESADRVNIVVANYDLFFSKLIHSQGESVWSRFGVVVFDECHDSPGVARRCFGRDLSVQQLEQVARDFGQFVGDHSTAKDLRNKTSDFFNELARYAVLHRNPRLTEANFVDASELIDILDDVMRAAGGNCGRCKSPGICATCIMWASIRLRAETAIDHLREAVHQSEPTTAYWLDAPSDLNRVTAFNVKLRAMPYRAGDQLNKYVFSRFPSVICVSATMTTDNSFDFIREELGLLTVETTGDKVATTRTWSYADYETNDQAAEIQGIRVPSPFNYAKQALFVVPLGIPWPIPENDDLFNAAAVDAIRTLIKDCKGRTLALFTSKRRLDYVAERLAGTIDYPLYVQGDAPNKQLAAMFRDTTNSVMLATKSFWVGLDVQGEALSCLVIDKLPLESLADPLMDMMKAKHPESFWNDFYFPRAAIELAQGAGRLIRSSEDRGVFVLLDSRIIGKGYGAMMRRSLPFVGYSKVLADAGKFLDAPP